LAALFINGSISAQTNCAPLPAGLVSWWAGEGNANDSEGANNGILEGGVTFVPGEVGNAFSFNGVDADVKVPASSSLDVGLAAGFTIELWIKPADLSLARPMVEWNSGEGSVPYGVHFWTSEQLPWGTGPGCLFANLIDIYGDSHYFSSDGGLLTTVAFQHVALTYVQATGLAVMYLNGSAVAQQNLGSFTPQTSSDLYLGFRPAGLSIAYRWVGQMDEVSLYGRALSAAEIQGIYAAGSAGKCPTPVAPFIFSQTLNQTVFEGATANLTVNAGGTAPLTYQWSFQGTNIAGATNTSLTLSNAQYSQSGDYAVAVSNAVGWAASSNAVLTVNGAPVILAQPGSQSVSPGSTVTFNVSAIGTPPLFYEWLNNGIIISGAASPSLVLTNAQPAMAGTYSALVFNLYGSVTSSNAVLVVYTPPTILAQPQSQTAAIGSAVTFNVTASGAPAPSYQWRLNSNNLPGATGSSLMLIDAQATNAGAYSVIVSNSWGIITSSNALLTVVAAPACVAAPSGLVGWWRGEGNTLDDAGGDNGIAEGNLTYGPGEVGQAFVFNGTNAYVQVPASSRLDVGTGAGFTIELWIKPADLSVARPMVEWNSEEGSTPYGVHFWASQPLPYGAGPGCLFANLIDTLGGSHYIFSAGNLLATNSFQHVALTFVQTNGSAVMYLNGSAVAQQDLGSFTPQTTFDLYLGCRPAGPGLAYWVGELDEVSLYSRALSSDEIQSIYAAGSSGKCVLAPSIVSQPQGQQVVLGTTASFSVVAGGAPPLSYQWQLNSNNIPGATGSSLVLTNVQFPNAGAYSVLVSNNVGAITSSAAILTVTYPPALVQAPNAAATGGGTAAVPILLVANGNENALGFTLNFDQALLAYSNTTLGSGATGAVLVVNAGQAANGLLGVGVGLPADAVFAAGTQEVALVTFTAAVVTNATSTALGFGNQVVKSQLVDANANPLPANFAAGVVTIAPTPIAGDVWPRPNGDAVVTIADWVLEGRYVAGLDGPTNASEFARADCAPRATGGDGAITIIDWVQVGRYMAGLDPRTPAGTNTGPLPGPADIVAQKGSPSGPLKNDQSRQLQVRNAVILQGQSGTVSVNLEALGDENALGFSLSFDPAVLTYSGYSEGSSLSGANGAMFLLNDTQAASGRLGFTLALQPGGSLAPGDQQLAIVNFSAASSVSGNCPVAFASQPVTPQVSDPTASALAAGYIDGAVLISSGPTLSVACSGQGVVLSWPLWAGDFALQEASGNPSSTTSWSSLAVTPTATADANVVTLPLSSTNKFYRLRQK
jgi:hypothetical protein